MHSSPTEVSTATTVPPSGDWPVRMGSNIARGAFAFDCHTFRGHGGTDSQYGDGGGGGAEKILTAGPSTWQSARINLVDELRSLVRARDMALAEQRARHVKESVAMLEQRYALAVHDPAFPGKIARLYGAADATSRRISKSPLSVSPAISHPGSPIGSPTAARPKRVDILPDRRAYCGKEDGRVLSESARVTGASKPDTTDISEPNMGNVEFLADAAIGDGTGSNNNSESRNGTPSPRVIGSAVASTYEAHKNEESIVKPCQRCMQLQHELDTALTDRTLAEAELVSLQRATSLMDTAWECDTSSGIAARNVSNTISAGPVVTLSEDDGGEKTASMPARVEADNSAPSVGLQDELGRLETRVSLAEEGLPPKDLDAHVVDSKGLPMQEFVLYSDEDKDNDSKMSNLAASLSSTIARRARHFEELSRKRLLRLGAEADLRAARAKLDTLLALASTPPPMFDIAEGGNGDGSGSSAEWQGEGERSSRHDDSIFDGVTREEERKRKDVKFPSTSVVASKRGEGFGTMGRGRRGRARGFGSQQQRRVVGTTTEPCVVATEEQVAAKSSGSVSMTNLCTEVTKKRSSHRRVAQARSPRSSSRRPKGAPSSAVQFRTLPSSSRSCPYGGDGGSIGRSKTPREAAREQVQREESAGDVVDALQPETVGRQISDVDRGGNSDRKHQSLGDRHTEKQVKDDFFCEGAADELAADATETPSPAVVAAAEKDAGRGKRETNMRKNNERSKGTTKTGCERVAGASLSKAARGATVRKLPGRLLEETAKKKISTRLGITTLAKRLSTEKRTEDSTCCALPTPVPPDRVVAGEEAEDAQKQGGGAQIRSSSLRGIERESSACDNITDNTAGDEEADEDGRATDPITKEEGGYLEASATSTRKESVSRAHRILAAPAVRHGEEAGCGGGTCVGDGSGGVFVLSDLVPDRTVCGNDLLRQSVEDLAEVLRIEVDRLRLEKTELEDTVAQLNVAAAQLYIEEYEHMKAKCRQLKRVVLGPASKPTEVESAYGHSCHEIMYRLKVIGVNFFRRRIGGDMGAKFFPDGLARTLALIGRTRVAKGCQTAPVERLGPLVRNGFPPPESKDVHVQVAGGIDEEDEPLMEQQVYALLGKLDLLLKRREDVLWTYHREAEEGAREARALLASAAAQHHPGKAWGVSRPSNLKQLIGGRGGPAGAPRPAINPTNLLFTAAVILDSVAATAAVPRVESRAPTSTPEKIAPAVGDSESRRQRYSAAEKALLELADEVVAALDVEQRRSDASAERRRFVADRQNSGGDGCTQVLGRPPLGVPPLVWAMEIHLVGKLARAFRTAVEARGFEREVEDANLVAAVTLGRSSSPSAEGGNNGVGPPWHLGHRMLSVLRGDGDEENARRQRARPGSGHIEESVMTDNIGERQRFDWDAETYSPHRAHPRPNSGKCNDGCKTNSPKNSPRRAEGLPRGEQSGRHATKDRTGDPDGEHGFTLDHPRTVARGKACERKPAHLYSNSRAAGGTRRNVQNQQQRGQQRRDSAAVARVEAAVFDTVRPSRLHPRPGSASVEGRSGRGGCYEGCSISVATERLRPQSARLAESRDRFPGEGGKAVISGCTAASGGIPPDFQRNGRLAFEVGPPPESNRTTDRQQRPVRPTVTSTATTAARRPASAGGRVVDTRIWSSNSNVAEVGADVFRCRPNKSIRTASVRFENAAAARGVPSSRLVPTHPGEVPEFLRRKEREVIEADRGKQAAVNGRFAVVHDDGNILGGRGGESITSRISVEHRAFGGPKIDFIAERRETGTSENDDGWERERGATLVGDDVGGCSAYDGRALSSVRLEDSMNGEGLLPDAGEQAFFDTWKPTGYGIDLGQYD